MKLWIGFLLFFTQATQVVMAQPIYKILHNDQLVGHLVGGMHYPGFGLDISVFKKLEKVIEASTSLHMEWKGGGATFPEKLKAFKAERGQSSDIFVRQYQFACLGRMLDKDIAAKVAVSYFDLKPLGFLMMAVIPVEKASTRIDGTTSSVDSYIKLRAMVKDLPVVEMESLQESLSYMNLIDTQEILQTAEIGCRRFYLEGFFLNPANVLEADQLFDNFQTGRADLMRHAVKQSYSNIGWSKKMLDAFFSKREERFALRIQNTLNQANSKMPLFLLGAAHIGDPDGTVGELRRLGYVLNRMEQ
jgi:uncharacterized protein YbaP (TraB family)